MADIKLVVDTSADLPEELRIKNDIGIVRFLTLFGEDTYVSGADITNEQFYNKLKECDALPTTSQTPYQDMYDYFLEESKAHETVIYFAISSKGSGQSNTAKLIAAEIKENDNPDADIRIVDTLSYSIYIADACLYAAELVRAGESADSVIDKSLERMKTWEAYLLVDDLGYLQKGGRITKTTAIVGSLLDIKPVLTIRDGLIEPLEKLRGKKKVLKKLVSMISQNPDFDEDNKEFMVIHSDLATGEEAVEELKEEFGDVKITLFSEFGPIVGTHTGPGCIAILFKIKK